MGMKLWNDFDPSKALGIFVTTDRGSGYSRAAVMSATLFLLCIIVRCALHEVQSRWDCARC